MFTLLAILLFALLWYKAAIHERYSRIADENYDAYEDDLFRESKFELVLDSLHHLLPIFRPEVEMFGNSKELNKLKKRIRTVLVIWWLILLTFMGIIFFS